MPEQVQDFYPTPSTLSTVMYYTGLDPRTMQPVYVPKDPREKAMQRALMQYKRPEKLQAGPRSAGAGAPGRFDRLRSAVSHPPAQGRTRRAEEARAAAGEKAAAEKKRQSARQKAGFRHKAAKIPGCPAEKSPGFKACRAEPRRKACRTCKAIRSASFRRACRKTRKSPRRTRAQSAEKARQLIFPAAY